MQRAQAAGAVIEITEAVDRTRREQYVANLAGLGHLPADAQPEPEMTQTPGLFDVKVNGTLIPVPVVAYEIVPTDAGPVVTITLAAASVSVGAKPPAPTSEQGRASRVWQAPTQDPRANIPGWKPEGVTSNV